MKLGLSRTKERIKLCRNAAIAVLYGRDPMYVDDLRVAMRKHIRDITMREAEQTVVYLCVEGLVTRHPESNKPSRFSLKEVSHVVV